jgi:CheY-like chemotaxis protein
MWLAPHLLVVVDGHPPSARAAQFVLEAAGYMVAVTSTGEQIRSILKRIEPSLAIIDPIKRGEFDGNALARLLVAGGVKLIVTPPHGGRRLPGGPLPVAPVAYLRKPYTREQLLAVVQKALPPRA